MNGNEREWEGMGRLEIGRVALRSGRVPEDREEPLNRIRKRPDETKHRSGPEETKQGAGCRV